MAISSGLSSQFGYSVNQADYDTTTTVTKFVRHNSADFMRTANRIQGSGIQSGVFGPVASHYIEATAAGEGQLVADIQDKGFLGLLELLMGSSSTAGPTDSAYTHTFTLADPVGKYRTLQVGRPTRGGTVVPQTATGCKITSAEFTCNVGETLVGTFSVDAKEVDSTTALASASYVSSAITFHSGLQAIKMGTFASESAVSGVRGASITFDRPMDVDDYTTVNNSSGVGYKSEPVINDFAAISGSITADWLAKATFEDLANANTGTSLVWEFVGTTLIGAATYPTLRFTVPGIYLESGSQGVDGPAELVSDWAWVWRYDGTNLPTIEVVNTETSV